MLSKVLITITLAAVLVFAQDKPANSENNFNIMVHPISTIFSAGVPDSPIFLYLTLEQETDDAKSYIFLPSLWSFETDYTDYTRVGLDVGIRKYMNGSMHKGFYLQTSVGGYYTKLDEIGGSGELTGFTGIWLGTIGTKGRWDNISVGLDAGLGLAYSSVEANADDEQTASASGRGIWADMNFTIGFSL